MRRAAMRTLARSSSLGCGRSSEALTDAARRKEKVCRSERGRRTIARSQRGGSASIAVERGRGPTRRPPGGWPRSPGARRTHCSSLFVHTVRSSKEGGAGPRAGALAARGSVGRRGAGRRGAASRHAILPATALRERPDGEGGLRGLGGGKGVGQRAEGRGEESRVVAGRGGDGRGEPGDGWKGGTRRG